jgi:ligand-binding sensor domain-containing protein
MIMRKLLCMMVTTFVVLTMLGQAPLFTHFKWFKVEDRLPQSFISALAQDRDGFLWIGTRDGLARYDGQSFKIFVISTTIRIACVQTSLQTCI